MGARHQLFVIACVNQRYRCLAALHHQSLSGEFALKRCLALLGIFQAEANRNAIQQELVAAKYSSANKWQSNKRALYGNLSVECGRETAPFPFIATCLVMGTSFNPIEGYQRRVHPLNHNMLLDEGDNNEGVTILDITNPGQTRYCFANLVECFWRSENNEYGSVDEDAEGSPNREIVPAETPLRASSYLWTHENRMDPNPEIQAGRDLLIQDLEKFPTVDHDSLRDLWARAPRSQQDEENIPFPITQNQTLHSLKDTAVEDFLKIALRKPENQTDAISEALQVPGMRLALRERLYAMAENETLVASPVILDLLTTVLSGEAYVDLGPLRAFSSLDLCIIISKLQAQGNMISLSLSNNLNVQENDLLRIMDTKSSLQNLHLLGETQVPFSGIQKVAKDSKTSLHKVYHAANLRQSFARDLGPCNADDKQYVLDLVHRPYPNESNTLAGAIWICIDGNSDKIVKSNAGNIKRVDWQSIKADEREYPSRMWPEGLEIKYGIFPLHDAIISPTRLTNTLINFKTCIYSPCFDMIYESSHIGLTFAKAVASASSCLDMEPMSDEVTALPPSLYAASSLAATSLGSPWPLSMPEMIPGQWTMVIIHEYVPSFITEKTGSTSSTRYALVSPVEQSAGASNTKFRVIDMETYLTIVMEGSNETDKALLVGHWKRNHPMWTSVCDEEEIHEVITVVAKKAAAATKGRHFKMAYGVPNGANSHAN